MRKLVWIAAGFAAAAFLAEYILPVHGLPYFAAALAVCGGLVLPWRRLPCRRAAAMLLLSAAAGAAYWWGWYALHAAPCEARTGENAVITARVTDWPLEREGYTRLSVTITGGAPRERAYLYVYDGELPALAPGDIVAGEIRVRSAMLRGEERAHSLTAAGRYLSGYFRGDVTVLGQASFSWIYFPQRIARYVGRTCTELLPGRPGVFLKALLTGDKEELYADVELYGDMRAAGVLHTVAVSGMHVFLLVEFLRRLFGRSRTVTALCIPVMAFFVLMSGAGPSVIRAAFMQTLYMSAPLVRRESDSPSSLAAALLLLLLINPMSIGGIGLQLSFACMAGYAAFMPRLMRRIYEVRWLRRSRLPAALARNAASTLSATSLSVPAAAHYFGAVPLLSGVANLLALPVISLLFAGGYVLCAVNAVLPGAARCIAWVLAWGVRWCLLVFRWVGRLPFACLYTADEKTAVWLVFSYALAGAWLLLRRRGICIAPALPAELTVIGLCALFLWNSLSLSLGRRELTAVDVGQGQCVLLLDRDAAVVIDCGGSGYANAGDTAADYLRAAGVRRVDALVLTHLDADHVNGVETLLYRMPVGTMILPADTDDPARQAELLAAAARTGTASVLLSEPGTLTLGDLTLDLLLPKAGGGGNDRGIVALAVYPGFSALIMGDAGQAAELRLLEAGLVPDVDVLVAGHHGSGSASCALFLRAAAAETAVISVGRGNAYGLPAEETLQRLENYCGAILRTDERGTVALSIP